MPSSYGDQRGYNVSVKNMGKYESFVSVDLKASNQIFRNLN